jgi:hypothetical protein
MALSHKLQTFVDVYDGDTNKAADIAGISRQYGRLLMVSLDSASARPLAREVQLAISQRRSTEMRDKILSRQQRQEFWTKIANGDPIQVGTETNKETGETTPIMAIPSVSDRLRASELLGKSELDFADKSGDNQTAIVVQINPPADASIDKDRTVEPGGGDQPPLLEQKQGLNGAQTGD